MALYTSDDIMHAASAFIFGKVLDYTATVKPRNKKRFDVAVQNIRKGDSAADDPFKYLEMIHRVMETLENARDFFPYVRAADLYADAWSIAKDGELEEAAKQFARAEAIANGL